MENDKVKSSQFDSSNLRVPLFRDQKAVIEALLGTMAAENRPSLGKLIIESLDFPFITFVGKGVSSVMTAINEKTFQQEFYTKQRHVDWFNVDFAQRKNLYDAFHAVAAGKVEPNAAEGRYQQPFERMFTPETMSNILYARLLWRFLNTSEFKRVDQWGQLSLVGQERGTHTTAGRLIKCRIKSFYILKPKGLIIDESVVEITIDVDRREFMMSSITPACELLLDLVLEMFYISPQFDTQEQTQDLVYEQDERER
jgi:hypothetical protein